MPNIKTFAKKLGLNNAYDIINKFYFRIALPFSHEYINFEKNEAERILNGFSPKPSGSCLAHNELTEPFKYDLQIIVPAYNVEKYLKECMASVLSQETDYKFIVTLIDDGSTDSTPEIADSYANDERVNIIHQKNRGFSGARNRGLEKIEAKYVMFVDSDDTVEQGAVQALMKTATEKNADIVEGGFSNLSDSVKNPQPNVDCITQVSAEKTLRGQPWAKVYRSSLFKNISFPEGFWFEDSINSFLIFPMAQTCYKVPDYVYIYRIQPESITRTAPSKPKCVDTYWITEMLISERKSLDLPQNESYYNKLLWQALLNSRRVLKMPEEVRKSIFVLTAKLIEENLNADCVLKKYKPLLNALFKKDYGAYMLYCRTHKQ